MIYYSDNMDLMICFNSHLLEQLVIRGGGRYEKLVVLLFTNPNRNVGGAKGCLLSKITKVGGAIAPTVLLPLYTKIFIQ